jgi:hypothetical protein
MSLTQLQARFRTKKRTKVSHLWIELSQMLSQVPVTPFENLRRAAKPQANSSPNAQL